MVGQKHTVEDKGLTGNDVKDITGNREYPSEVFNTTKLGVELLYPYSVKLDKHSTSTKV
jgi:hypothetical protein